MEKLSGNSDRILRTYNLIIMQEENGESTGDLSDTTKQAFQIKDSIKELEKELVYIQSNCKHSEHEIKNCPSNSTSFQLRRVCKKCTMEIGYPSKEEIDSWVSS